MGLGRSAATGVVLVATLMLCVTSAEAQCKETMQYLSSRIPAVKEKSLSEVRDTILKTDIGETIKKIKASGLSLRDAAAQMMEQAAANEKSRDTAEEIVRKASDSAATTRILSALKARRYEGLDLSGRDVLGSAINTYILNDWSAEANREAAIQVGCNADRGK